MTDFQPRPAVIREMPGYVVCQVGARASVNGAPCMMTTAETVLGNPQHYLRKVLPSAVAKMAAGEVSAIVHFQRDDQPTAYIQIFPAGFAAGAPERARYADWIADLTARKAASTAAEHAYDVGTNEGGEGYNPHRSGAAPTYVREDRRERDYPDGA